MIVAIGDHVLIPGEVNKDIIEMLEGLLTEAKNGEVTSLAVIKVNPKGDIVSEFVVGASQSHDLGFGIAWLNNKFFGG